MSEDNTATLDEAVSVPSKLDLQREVLRKHIGERVIVTMKGPTSFYELKGTLKSVNGCHFQIDNHGTTPFSYDSKQQITVSIPMRDEEDRMFEIKKGLIWVLAYEKIYDHKEQ